jgi:hypothetical protein
MITSALCLVRMGKWSKQLVFIYMLYFLAICNAYNVDKLLVVNPLEFMNYYSDDPLDNPIETENETHEKVLKEFKKSVIMRVNMVFGTNSYMIRYLQQNWLCNHAPFDAEKFKHFRFNPM